MGRENRQIWTAMFNPVLSRRDIQWLLRGVTNGGLADYLGSWQMALFEAQESPFDVYANALLLAAERTGGHRRMATDRMPLHPDDKRTL